jgi:hypothetical protein
MAEDLNGISGTGCQQDAVSKLPKYAAYEVQNGWLVALLWQLLLALSQFVWPAYI